MPLINCETELDLIWSRYFVITEIINTPEILNTPIQKADATLTKGETFKINNTKLYVPVVTLSKNDNIKFLDNIKQIFKKTISRNKHRPEITTQPKNNNLDYLIDLHLEILTGCLFFRLKMVTGIH